MCHDVTSIPLDLRSAGQLESVSILIGPHRVKSFAVGSGYTHFRVVTGLDMRQTIQSQEIPTPKTAYSQAVTATGSHLLFISGQVKRADLKRDLGVRQLGVQELDEGGLPSLEQAVSACISRFSE